MSPGVGDQPDASIAYRSAQKKLGQEYSSVDGSGQEEMYSDVLFFHKRRGNFKNLCSKGRARALF